MQISDAVFFLTASAVLVTTLTAIFRRGAGRDRIHYALFFILYGTLTVLFLSDMQKPSWLPWIYTALFAAGGLWFWIDPVSRAWHQKRQASKELRNLKKEKGCFFEVIAACKMLSEAKVGGFIAIERRQSLQKWIEKAVYVDAAVSRELLFTVFFPDCPLHDGAAVIRKDRLAACGVIAPLSFADDLPKDLGTRHRAALGFSKTTDALCIIVSEESGTISMADRGALYYDLPFDKLAEFLTKGMRFRLGKKRVLPQTLELAQT